MASIYAGQLRVLGPTLLAVHYIGSTAVPGLAAKPIIDLMPIVTDLQRLDQARGEIERLGYKWLGERGIPGRRYCTLQDHAGARRAHVHFFQTGSAQITRHLAFRDYLRAHEGIARSDEREKHRACSLHPNDSRAYTDEKAAWVRAIEADALVWFGRQQ